MEKLYRLHRDAKELLTKRGHVFSRFDKEFKIVEGVLVKTMRNRCNRCGAWVRITDYPKFIGFTKEMDGPAFEFNCKNGAVPVEVPEFGNFFSGKGIEAYKEKLKDKKRKTLKKFKM